MRHWRELPVSFCQRREDVQCQSSNLLQLLLPLLDLLGVGRAVGGVVGLLDLISFRYLVDSRLIASAGCFAENGETHHFHPIP